MDELPNKLQTSVAGSSLTKKNFPPSKFGKAQRRKFKAKSLTLKVLSLKAQTKKFKEGARLYVATR